MYDNKLRKLDGVQPIFLQGPGGIDISHYLNKLGMNVAPPNSTEYFFRTLRDYKYSIAIGIACIIIIIILIVMIVKYFTKT